MSGRSSKGLTRKVVRVTRHTLGFGAGKRSNLLVFRNYSRIENAPTVIGEAFRQMSEQELVSTPKTFSAQPHVLRNVDMERYTISKVGVKSAQNP